MHGACAEGETGEPDARAGKLAVGDGGNWGAQAQKAGPRVQGACADGEIPGGRAERMRGRPGGKWRELGLGCAQAQWAAQPDYPPSLTLGPKHRALIHQRGQTEKERERDKNKNHTMQPQTPIPPPPKEGVSSERGGKNILEQSTELLDEGGRRKGHPGLLPSWEPPQARSPRMRRASWMSLGMMVTRLAWMAHRLVSSKRPTR